MNPTLQTLQQLRSTHGNFSDRSIPDGDLQTILDTCVLAANASNKQSYSIIVVKDKARLQELTPYTGSAALVFCVDFNRLKQTAERLDIAYEIQGIMPFLTAYTDVCLAAQTSAIAAQSLGVDSLFTNGIHRGDIERVYRALELPERFCFPVIEVVLGYSDGPAPEKRGRLTGPGIVHQGTYHWADDEDLDRIIAAYDDPEEHLALSTNWRETHEHFLSWFFSVWMNRMPDQEDRSQLFSILERGGFLGNEL